jgi:PAS domain S-box-containing protein
VALNDTAPAGTVTETLAGGGAPLAAVFEHAALGIAVVDMTGRPVAVNPALVRMLGFEENELREMLFTDFTHPDDIQADVDLFVALMAGERESYRIEKRYLHRNGDLVWGRLAVSLIRSADGEPQFALALLEDVTELRRAEEALRASEEQHRGAQRMEAIGQLAGGIAHDFNNLLGIVIGSADLLDFYGSDEEMRVEQLARIREAAERAAALTRQLLAFARKQRFDLQVFRLNGVVEETLLLLGRVFPANIAIASRLDPELGFVRADSGQLGQVIMNLALNARDAMPAGGLLEIATANVDIAAGEGIVPPGSYVVLSVADDGIGMDAGTAAQAFNPFFTTKGDGGGTGLGLSTVFGIVKQSGGFISVESKPGQGSTFVVYLPQTEDEPADPSPPTERAVPVHTRATILLVDDEPIVRTVVRQMLEARGYAVVTAATGEEALGVAAHERNIDLVVSDLVMAGMGGVELVEQIRQNGRSPIKVLYISGHSEDRHRPEPGAHYLQKPFAADMLVDAVERALAG